MNSSINHKVFDHITRSPKKFSKNNISFMSRGRDEFSLGFVIPKSLGSAVMRNRFKRRCRFSLLKLEQQNLLPLCGVVIKPKTININYNNINESIGLWVDAFDDIGD